MDPGKAPEQRRAAPELRSKTAGGAGLQAVPLEEWPQAGDASHAVRSLKKSRTCCAPLWRVGAGPAEESEACSRPQGSCHWYRRVQGTVSHSRAAPLSAQERTARLPGQTPELCPNANWVIQSQKGAPQVEWMHAGQLGGRFLQEARSN